MQRSAEGCFIIPVKIGEKVYDFLFDTGSSIFSFVVSPENRSLLCNPDIDTDTLRVPSWGEYIYLYGADISAGVEIGSYKLTADPFIAYSSTDFSSFFEEEEILGLMGNIFFLDKTIIIDFPNKRFGIVHK